MTEHRHYSGPDLAPLLRQVRDELGSDAEIIRAERIRTGGLAGFFAREHYEVVAKRPKVDSSVPPGPTTLPEAKPDGAQEPVADEPIGRMTSPTGPADSAELVSSTSTGSASKSATTHTRPDPARPGSMKTAGGSGRSIQAALLDRADRVSTEELLVRVAETHSAEWGSESFQSILGRAMVEAVDPMADGASINDRRRDLSQIDSRPYRPDDSIDGLRLESIEPGENVVDPVPQPPPVESPAGEVAGGHQERESSQDQSMSPVAGVDGWRDEPHGPVPPQWANGVPTPWGPPWMPGWAPWMINGWPGQAPGELISGSAPHLLCANCAEPIAADAEDDSSAPPTVDGEATEGLDAESWSELRREIDDVRLRLDNIIGTIRHATAHENVDEGPDSSESGLDDTEPLPGRRDKNHPRSGRTGR